MTPATHKTMVVFVHPDSCPMSTWDTVTIVATSERRRQDPAVIRRVMQANRNRDTRPELELRRALHGRGVRYRLHPRDVVGRPDLVIRTLRLAVFVDGDMWHGNEHRRRGLSRMEDLFPTNTDFWVRKIQRNIERDREVNAELTAAGWTVVRLWESDIRDDLSGAVDRVVSAVEDARSTREARGTTGAADRGGAGADEC